MKTPLGDKSWKLMQDKKNSGKSERSAELIKSPLTQCHVILRVEVDRPSLHLQRKDIQVRLGKHSKNNCHLERSSDQF